MVSTELGLSLRLPHMFFEYNFEKYGFRMKKTFCKIVFIVCAIIILACVFKSGRLYTKNDMAVVLCISGLPMANAITETWINEGGIIIDTSITKENKFVMEDIRMQIVYQLARRSIVKITVKDSAGSGIIWHIDDGIVIVSNRHLLMKDVKAEVVFCNGETVEADILGYSQQYDIGFIKVSEKNVSNKILRDIFEAVPILYETENKTDKDNFAAEYSGRQVLQISANIDKNVANFSVGSISGLNFIPLFNTNVLVTHCYARAGMSGGGVFDDGGRFLGMISGGEVPEDAQIRETDWTYSIPARLIAMEYNEVLGVE